MIDFPFSGLTGCATTTPVCSWRLRSKSPPPHPGTGHGNPDWRLRALIDSSTGRPPWQSRRSPASEPRWSVWSSCAIFPARVRIARDLLCSGCVLVDAACGVRCLPPASAGVIVDLALTVEAEPGVRQRVQPVLGNAFLAVLTAPLTKAIRSLSQARQSLLDLTHLVDVQLCQLR